MSLSPSLLLLQLLLSLPEVAGRASVPEALLLLLRPPWLPAVPLDSPILPSAIPPACTAPRRTSPTTSVSCMPASSTSCS